MFLATAFAAVLQLASGASPIPWMRDHDAAFRAAEERRAPLLVQFSSASCPGTIVGQAASALNDEVSDCDRMEERVWSRDDVKAAAARYVPLLTGDTSDRTVTRRYEVATLPTTLIADPWGNEIVRLVHFVEAPRLVRILSALPADFAGLEPVGRALRERPDDPSLLVQAAAFYEGARLFEFAEKQYERAWRNEGARKDRGLRQRLGVARGTNLLRMGKASEASRAFRDAAEEAPSEPQADVALFGWMMAELQQGRRKDAEKPYELLLARHPSSRYTGRAKEAMSVPSPPR